MKTRLLAILLLAGSALFARTFVSVGVGVGRYYPPPPVYAAPAAAVWIPGYYYPVGARWAWRAGYWEHPPYAGARWVAPRYYGGRYYRGYWRR